MNERPIYYLSKNSVMDAGFLLMCMVIFNNKIDVSKTLNVGVPLVKEAIPLLSGLNISAAEINMLDGSDTRK